MKQVKKIENPFQHVRMHQDILTHMFNPTNDDRKAYQFNTSHGTLTMYNAPNEKSEMSSIKPLPKFAEYKMLMSILYYGQQKGIDADNMLFFGSSNNLLQKIGYTVCADNYELLQRTVEAYQWFRIHYQDSIILDNVPDDDLIIKYNEETKLHTVNFGILMGFSKESTTNRIASVFFDPTFWKLCKGTYGYIHNANLSVIKELSSPRELQIYLYLCKWMSHTQYMQWSPVPIKMFIEELGITFNEDDSRAYAKLAFDIRKTLAKLRKIDITLRSSREKNSIKNQQWNLKLREELFRTQRKIQFVSPVMRYTPLDIKNKNIEMADSEWISLFPELLQNDWFDCKRLVIIPGRKTLPKSFIDRFKKQIIKDPYADL